LNITCSILLYLTTTNVRYLNKCISVQPSRNTLPSPVAILAQPLRCYGFKTSLIPIYSAPVGERSIVISLSVCLCVSVRPRAYLWKRSTDLQEIFCADRLRPWLGPPRAALRYAMYFRFYG